MMLWLQLLALAWAFYRLLFADRGAFPFRPGIRIYEPKQRSLLAWNGEEEIMLLTTDLHASERTEVLEVLPLPAEPKVKKGSLETFQQLMRLIAKKLETPPFSRSRRGNTRSLSPVAPAGEVTFHEQIGAHNISVVKALNSLGFIAWVEEYLRKAGIAQPDLPPTLEALIGDYIRRGMIWFVFDAITLENTPRTNEPIQYRFRTPYLYYPLVISSLAEGKTEIELFVLTHQPLNHFAGLPIERVLLPNPPVQVTPEELRGVDIEIGEFMGDQGSTLRVWRMEGQLTSFDKDLIALYIPESTA
jgi:hypothetical protein